MKMHLTNNGKGSRSVLSALIGLGLLILCAGLIQHRVAANVVAGSTTKQLVVSNDRDAGPLSLRDAIVAADRMTTRASIVIAVRRIVIESPLPALTNPHGVDIASEAEASGIDASHLQSGAAMQINSPTSTVKRLQISGARSIGIIVNARGVQLDAVSVSDSKVGILIGADSVGSSVRGALLEHDDTGVMAEPGVRGVILGNVVFRGNTRAGFWLVAADGVESSGAGATGAVDQGAVRVHIEGSLFERNGAGIVVANQATRVRNCRFVGNLQSAVTVLGGALGLDDSDIRNSTGPAVSVNSSSGVVLGHNTFTDNLSAAIAVRDSQIVVRNNTLLNNALGITVVSRDGAPGQEISDNVITQATGDGITLIGGGPVLQRNRVSAIHGVALRVLDLVQGKSRVKAEPHLDANALNGSGGDQPVFGSYVIAGEP